MAKKSFKVVIVGASVAGLSLANMLEQLGIDFVLLEAYYDIAPQVGASIGLYPNFARLLDQIGCYDALRSLLDETVNQSYYRNPRGEAIFSFRGLSDCLERRHGYPVMFLDRQILLRVLRDNLQQKNKVLVRKRIVKIETIGSGIRVIAEDNSSYEGDIVIGADGIHSTVRKEMHRLGKRLSPGYFDDDEYSKVPCTYRCIFGMSHPTKGIQRGTSHVIMNKGFSYLILTGPQGRVYWFLNVKNDKVTYGKEVPQYSKEDEQSLAEEHLNDRLNECDVFGDLYKNRISSTLTPLHEYQWLRWHFGRIMTIGDASHKLNPITGFGGACAIEGAAALVNALKCKMNQRPNGLSEPDIQAVFDETQAVREKRTQHLLNKARMMQSFDSLDIFIAPLVAKFIIPNLTEDMALQVVGLDTVEGTRLESSPMPKRPRYVPFTDELPTKPMKDAWFLKAFTAILFSLILYLSWFVLKGPGVSCNGLSSAALQLVHTGTARIDQRLADTVQVAHTATHLKIPCQKLQVAYFMASLLPTILIWTIEDHRQGNHLSLASWPTTTLFFYALSLLGLGKVMPLYCLFSLFTSSRPAYAMVTGRPVPPSMAKAILIAAYVGYAFPTLLMMIPWMNRNVRDFIITLCRFSPLYACILIQIIAGLISQAQARAQTKILSSSDMKDYLRIYHNEDAASLRIVYRFVFFMATLAHIVFVSLFICNNLPTSTKTLLKFLQYDITLYIVATVIWSLYSVYEMRRLGYTTTQKATKAALSILAGTFMVGPGAVYVGTWHWREDVILTLNK